MAMIMKNMQNIQFTMGASMRNLETNQASFNAIVKNLEAQMGKMAQSLKQNSSKSFPSDIEIRSGRELADSTELQKQAIQETEEKNAEIEKALSSVEMNQEEIKMDNTQKNQEKEEMVPRKLNYSNKPPIYTPPSPFPQRLRKAKLDAQFAKFLDIFKKLEVNIPFVDALAQMSNYEKFMKDIMSNKKKLDLVGTVSLLENYSAIIQTKLPKKLSDPSSFIIPYVIGEQSFKKALCDLGANINVKPLFMANKLNLGEPTSIALSLLMADRSLTYPQGIIKDVFVKVDKFIFSVDFVVLDMEEDKEAPLILGRPFLETVQALINVKDGELTLRVGDDQVKFNLYKNLKFYGDDRATCLRIDSFYTFMR